MLRESADAPFGIIFKKKIKGRSATGEGKGELVKAGIAEKLQPWEPVFQRESKNLRFP